MLPDAQFKDVDEVLGDFCRREPPPNVRPQLEYAARIDGNTVTLVKLRPAFCAEVGRTESLVARFRYIATRSVWELYWRDRNSHWHHYPRVRPAKRLATLFAEVHRDPTHIFWG
jgi:hypothetical protein